MADGFGMPAPGFGMPGFGDTAPDPGVVVGAGPAGRVSGVRAWPVACAAVACAAGDVDAGVRVTGGWEPGVADGLRDGVP